MNNVKEAVKEVKSKKEVTTSKVTVSPVQASNWLMKNTSNRPLSERFTIYLTRQITKGKWKMTTDAIGFDANGKLINGQHRLSAVVRANKDCDFLVAYGLDPDAFNTIDTGRLRSGGDVLGVHGFNQPSALSAVIRFILAFNAGFTMGSVKGVGPEVKPSNQDVLDFAMKNRVVLEDTMNIALMTTKEFKGLPARLTGGLIWVLGKIDREAMLEFFDKLATGIGLTKDSPIYQLRKKLMDDMASKKKYPDKDKIAFTILAWNHWRVGNKIQKLQWAGDGKAAFPKPK